MRINTNLNAMTALNQMGKNTALAGTSMNKISSGERINKAGDDAAGMAISEKMRGQIRGLDQASKNAQDGISVVQTAEGAMEEIGNIAQRMRELTVQASNETNKAEDREKITTELKQLHSEIDRIAESTQFNGKNLLANKVEGAATVNGSGMNGEIGNLDAFKNVFVGGKDTSLSELIQGGKVELTYNKTDDKYGLEIKDKDGNVVAKGAAQVAEAGGKLTFKLTSDGAANFKYHDPADGSLKDMADTNITLDVKADELKGNGLIATGNKISVDIKSKADDLDMKLQVGANTGDSESLTVNIANMTTDSLGLLKTDIDAITNADLTKGTEASKKLIENLDKALETVNTNRANLGATQNRLETAQSNLTTSSENLTAAESRIRDVDVAKEMMNLSKLNLLTQASQAMAGQAKQQPEGVMQLLR
ncbi:flagellar hook-associated protein FlgL [Paraclostridium bifermentans]|uniref:flagellar hook-associated protein FlgL n=1 Tax=Paraclostridium bifermentans TaxID=1490 RepID=UPI00115B5408|nr:flagellar hook-associated protein FlgL [Paraclostridium bifermentans]TQO58831.1 flagellar hook-associated protein 3 [Paraclostridium bifermentans]GKZ01624.1 flagellin [Paraclostridium bifermentans]GKZ07851.1 flagellin [Paraclostridium bifermentans]GKZ09874.1 flagellin [Paraclostridium bifermentans]